MSKSILTTSLFLLVLSFWSCSKDTNKETTTSVEEKLNEMVDKKKETQKDAVPNKSEQYTIVVLNDSIKSPRKELRGQIDGIDIVINYGSPAANGRVLFGDLVPYGKVWRTGANEAVSITLSAPMVLGENSDIAAGTYGLFTLPEDQENWSYIFNKVSDQWGAYDYDVSQDVARVKTTTAKGSTFAERMDFSIVDNELRLHWGDLIVPISLKKAS